MCLVFDLVGGVYVAELPERVAGQVNTESFQSCYALGHQDEPHSRFLSHTAALIDSTTLALGAQRDRTHQTGNASAENRYVHWPNPGEHRSAI